MITLSANLTALVIYLFSTVYFGRRFVQQKTLNSPQLLWAAATSLIAHGIGVYSVSITERGFNFSFFVALSMVFWTVNAIVFISGLKKALHNLFLMLFPLSALAVLASILGHKTEQVLLDYTIATHVVLSILAYSLLTSASLQALLLAYQNSVLKNKHMSSVGLLPPLQTMESLLFELLWVGEILLTLSIISGFYFLEDMFAQHLAHKTVFALIAWTIYALLLWGRHQMGWRGNKAIRWALAGFICLMLAYFGSKLVLEIILQRG